MDEVKVKRAKMWNYAVFGVLMALLAAVGIFVYRRTFTAGKWRDVPEERFRIVQNLLDRYKLIGMTEAEITALLGEEEQYANERTSFKLHSEPIDSENSLVYNLGVSYMDDEWLVILTENKVATGYFIDIS